MRSLLPVGAALALAAVGPVWADSDDTGPSFSQTIRGVTLHLNDVHWLAFEIKDPLFPYQKSFYFNYTVQAGPGVAPPPTGKSLLDCVSAITAVSPDGAQIGSGGGYATNAAGAKTDASVNWNDVDPRWPQVEVDVDFVDPAAPPKASGFSVAPVIIGDIPVPTQPDTVTPVHAETVTPLGTHVIVEKIKVSPAATGVKTWIVFRVVPAPDAPDLRFNSPWVGGLADETGAVVSRRGYGFVSSGDTLNVPATGGVPNEYTAGIPLTPATGAKTLRLTLDATESSVLLKQDSWYRHFRLHIPLTTIWAGDPSSRKALEAVKGSRVEASLESLAPAWGHYRARLILRDRSDPTVLWRVRAVRARDDAGNALTSQPNNDAFLWQVDGDPLRPGDTACEAMLNTPGANGGFSWNSTAPAAKVLTLEADAEAMRLQSHVLDFPLVPVPAPGQTLTLDRHVGDASGARLVLRKVTAFSPSYPLPAAVTDGARGFAATTGLAVELAEPPDPHGATYFDFSLGTAADPTGHRLGLLYDLASNFSEDPARVVTFLLSAPAPGAATFRLRLRRDEMISLGEAETLTFPPAPAPAFPDKTH